MAIRINKGIRASSRLGWRTLDEGLDELKVNS
jgi:hypothetical protein